MAEDPADLGEGQRFRMTGRTWVRRGVREENRLQKVAREDCVMLFSSSLRVRE
jgi:hypothetical protein